MRRVWVLLAGVALAGSACSQGSSDAGLAGAPQRQGAPEAIAPGGGVPGGSALPSVSPAVIRTARLDLLVDRGGFLDAVDRATATATAHGGFVVQSSVRGREARSGSLVLRVPADRFDAAMRDLRTLGRIREESISSDDVSEEFIDLEARRRHLAVQEGVMLDLMAEAQTVAATIRVQHELEAIQLEIERIEGRLRFLRDQTALGTITLHLLEEGEVAATEPGIFGRAWRAAVDGFVRIVAAVVVVLGYVAPFAMGAGAGLLVWSLVRRRRARTAVGA